MSTAASTNTGRVTQIIGSTFDVEFSEENLPEIYNAIKVQAEIKGVKIDVTGEVQQHLGGGRVRCVALGSTEGMIRGMEVTDTGSPVSIPVGKETLGRVFNLLGDPIDGRGPVEAAERWPIHREAPKLQDLSSKTEVFETGIKVVDLLTPQRLGLERVGERRVAEQLQRRGHLLGRSEAGPLRGQRTRLRVARRQRQRQLLRQWVERLLVARARPRQA